MSASPGWWETQDKNTGLGRVRARGAPGDQRPSAGWAPSPARGRGSGHPPLPLALSSFLFIVMHSSWALGSWGEGRV